MHELAVTQAILDTALRHAQQADARAIRALDVRVGALSGIVADSVRFYFEMISRDTLAEGATLRIEIIPPRARCRSCGTERDLPRGSDEGGVWAEHMQTLAPCVCGRQTYELVGGVGCYLDSMDVD